MQQLTNIQAIETAVNEYGEIVISKNSKKVSLISLTIVISTFLLSPNYPFIYPQSVPIYI